MGRALHGIEDVKPSSFQEGSHEDDDRQLGVIAQEVKAVIPEVVRTQQLPKQKKENKLKSLRSSQSQSDDKEEVDPSSSSSSGSESDDGTFLQVDYGAIVPLLIEAVRELDSRVG